MHIPSILFFEKKKQSTRKAAVRLKTVLQVVSGDDMQYRIDGLDLYLVKYFFTLNYITSQTF